jgi:hypothetical protein
MTIYKIFSPPTSNSNIPLLLCDGGDIGIGDMINLMTSLMVIRVYNRCSMDYEKHWRLPIWECYDKNIKQPKMSNTANNNLSLNCKEVDDLTYFRIIFHLYFLTICFNYSLRMYCSRLIDTLLRLCCRLDK